MNTVSIPLFDTMTSNLVPAVLVSQAMRRTVTLGTTNDLFWDGFMAYCEGAQIEEMPTQYHARGWYAALKSQAETEYVQEQS